MSSIAKLQNSGGEAFHPSVDCTYDFDVEVWKARQQSLFATHLAKAKKKMEHKIRSSVKKEQLSVMQELEETRAKLELATEALEEAQRQQLLRGELLDARERAMEERRLQLSSQQEQVVTQLESENQRTRERYQVLVDGLREQLREKEHHVLALQDRLRISEESYDRLRRRVLRARGAEEQEDNEEEEGEVWQSPSGNNGGEIAMNKNEKGNEDSNGELASNQRGGRKKPIEDSLLYKEIIMGTNRKYKQRIHQLQDELVFANATIQDLNQILRREKEKNKRLNEEKRESFSALRQREEDLLQQVKRTESLQNMLEEKEKTALEARREELVRRERGLQIRELEFSNALGAGSRTLDRPMFSSLYPSPITRAELISAYAKARSPTKNGNNFFYPPSVSSTPGLHLGEVESAKTADVVGAIHVLRRELEAHWKAPASGELCRTPYPPSQSPCVLAETSPSSFPHPKNKNKRKAMHRTSPPGISSCISSTSTNSSSSVSSFSVGMNANAKDKKEPSTKEMKKAETPRVYAPARNDEEKGKNASQKDILLTGVSRKESAVSSPLSSTLSPGFTGKEIKDRISNPSSLAVAPAHSQHSYPAASDGTNLTDVLAVSPLPEEFVQASNVTSVESSTVAEEMRQFVQQLKMNRQRLLETRVYTEDHPVLQEMSAKLRLYEEYLQEHT